VARVAYSEKRACEASFAKGQRPRTVRLPRQRRLTDPSLSKYENGIITVGGDHFHAGWIRREIEKRGLVEEGLGVVHRRRECADAERAQCFLGVFHGTRLVNG
jgi:hypothetical protein